MSRAQVSRGRAGIKGCTTRTLYGLSKAPELALDNDTLHELVYRETGKSSIKLLKQTELDWVCGVLLRMKDRAQGHKPGQKRTDTGGNPATETQRRKVYALTEQLGWNNDNRRINGFSKRMFGVERIEWLNHQQCSKLIEALKQMVSRERNTAAAEQVEKQCAVQPTRSKRKTKLPQ